MGETLNVFFLTAEADPFVKVGGLGDVAGSLPLALRAVDANKFGIDGVDMRLVLPLHSVIDRQKYTLQPVVELEVPHSGGTQQAEAFRLDWQGMPVYMIAGSPITEAGSVYTGDALIDGAKFTFYSLAALELARALDWQPDILHGNDWHTSPAIYWLALNRKKDSFYRNTATLLGLHNLPYLGEGTEPVLSAYGLPQATDSSLPTWARGMPLPLGLLSADHIVAVSPGYAQEVLTPEFGSGLQDFLQTRQASISGILNGIDQDSWDPVFDEHIPTRYSATNLPLRAKNKSALQSELSLPIESQTMLFSMVTRLFHQKGVDLAIDALRDMRDLPWQLVILGTGEPELEADAVQLQEAFPENVRSVLRFDAGLARRIYAGADTILIPSRYEPCGLTQMIAMRYGCVPVARATGGLRDTIGDYHQEKSSTGFLFQETDPAAMAMTLRRSLEVYADKRRWQGLQRRGMRQDFTWNRSAEGYLNRYLQLIQDRVGGGK